MVLLFLFSLIFSHQYFPTSVKSKENKGWDWTCPWIAEDGAQRDAENRYLARMQSGYRDKHCPSTTEAKTQGVREAEARSVFTRRGLSGGWSRRQTSGYRREVMGTPSREHRELGCEDSQTSGPQKELWNDRETRQRFPEVLKYNYRDWIWDDNKPHPGEVYTKGSSLAPTIVEYFFPMRKAPPLNHQSFSKVKP